jgi:hypothetical protein
LAYFYLQCNVSDHTCPFIICIFNVFMRACISVNIITIDHTFKSIYIACMYAKYFQYSVSEIERFANHFSKQYTETILSPAPSMIPPSTQIHTRIFLFFFAVLLTWQTQAVICMYMVDNISRQLRFDWVSLLTLVMWFSLSARWVNICSTKHWMQSNILSHL